MTSTTRPPIATRESLDADLDVIEAAFEAMTDAAAFGGFDPDDAVSASTAAIRGLLSQPAAMSRRLFALGMEQTRIALGTAKTEPDPRDRRFADDWFSTNPIYRRLAQAHVANERALNDLVGDLDLDDKTRLQAELLSSILTSTLAPTNHLLGNPAALKEAWGTRGRSLVNGLGNAVNDLVNNGAMPSMVDTEPFVIGENIAATPGAVVFRNEIIELLRYTPTTTEVHERPVFIVPPQINKYYVLDLAPGRSLAEHLVSNGHQVFMVSWRNPTAEHRAWGLDAYVDALMEASDAAMALTGSDDLNLLGVCAGGITAAALAGYLAAVADPRVHSLSLLVTIIDWARPSTMGSFVNPMLTESAKMKTSVDGVLSGEDLSRTFAWLRPNDLVWNYWVNNYLQGKNPAAFDVLAWNVDSTNLPAALHQDFMTVAAENAMTEAGGLTVKGEPIDLGAVLVDNYVVGAVTDHITPWKACYETVRLLGGSSRFVLSSQGHIQALVNPSGNPKGSFQRNDAGDAAGAEAEAWLDGAETHGGSWWDDWAGWLGERAGDTLAAPSELGSDDYPEICEAPGTYVKATA